MSSTADTPHWWRFWRRFRKNSSALFGAILLVFVLAAAVLTPYLATHDPVRNDLMAQFAPPSAEHWLGTDQFGRDVYSRVMWGTRTSFLIGFATLMVGGIAGVVLGLLSGFSGGIVDEVLTRFIDVLMSFPAILIALVIVGVAGGSNVVVVLAISVALVPRFARVVRGQVINLKRRDFVVAATALGASASRVLLIHILRNAVGPILVLATLYLPYAILVEATLTFLGVGVSPEQPTWGRIIADGRSYLQFAWWISVFPGIAIMITVMAFNLLGDGLRDLLDPRLRQ